MGNIWQQLWLCAATARSVHAELKPEQSHGPASPFHSHWDRARRSSGTRMASAVVRASVWVSPSAPAHIFCVTAVCSAKSRNSSTFSCTEALWVSAGWPWGATNPQEEGLWWPALPTRMLHHPLGSNREIGPLLSIGSEQSQLFPGLPTFAAHTPLLFLAGTKLVQRSSTGISLVKKKKKKNHCVQPPCPAVASSSSSQPPSLADAHHQLLFPAVATICCGKKEAAVPRLWLPVPSGHSEHLPLPGAGWWVLQGWALQVPGHHQGHSQLGKVATKRTLRYWERSFYWPPWRPQLWGHLSSSVHKPRSKMGWAHRLFHPTLSHIWRYFCTSVASPAFLGLLCNV